MSTRSRRSELSVPGSLKHKPAWAPGWVVEPLEPRCLLSVSLAGATNLGALVGRRTFADSVNGSTNTADVRKFSLSPGGSLSASLSGMSANADLQLIRDANNNQVVDSGEILAQSSKTGTALDSINKSLSAGTYFVRVFSVGGATTNYSLALISDYAPNTLATARNVGTVGAKVRFSDFVGSADTQDFYKFSLATPRTLVASLSGLGADANLQIIRDANGNGTVDSGEVLAASSNTGSTAENITKSLGAGTYFARVYRNTGDTNYSLSLYGPSLLIQFDYRFDTSGFFAAHPTAKDRLNDAAAAFSQITDTLATIRPTTSNTWKELFPNPGASGGPQVSITNPTVNANTLVVYIGARSDLSGLELGQGGPGGYSASGTQTWLNTVKGRGQAGALANPATDFAPWGGIISFSSNATWNFGSNLPTSSQNDFLTVATHELGHVLGIGTAQSWKSKISGTTFTGSHVRAANGGVNAKLSPDLGHFLQGTVSTAGGKSQEVVMEPALQTGRRRAFTKLDYAGLADIGWQVPASAGVSVMTGSRTASPATTAESTGVAAVISDVDSGSRYWASLEPAVVPVGTCSVLQLSGVSPLV